MAKTLEHDMEARLGLYRGICSGFTRRKGEEGGRCLEVYGASVGCCMSKALWSKSQIGFWSFLTSAVHNLLTRRSLHLNWSCGR